MPTSFLEYRTSSNPVWNVSPNVDFTIAKYLGVNTRGTYAMFVLDTDGNVWKLNATTGAVIEKFLENIKDGYFQGGNNGAPERYSSWYLTKDNKLYYYGYNDFISTNCTRVFSGTSGFNDRPGTVDWLLYEEGGVYVVWNRSTRYPTNLSTSEYKIFARGVVYKGTEFFNISSQGVVTTATAPAVLPERVLYVKQGSITESTSYGISAAYIGVDGYLHTITKTGANRTETTITGQIFNVSAVDDWWFTATWLDPETGKLKLTFWTYLSSAIRLDTVDLDMTPDGYSMFFVGYRTTGYPIFRVTLPNPKFKFYNHTIPVPDDYVLVDSLPNITQIGVISDIASGENHYKIRLKASNDATLEISIYYEPLASGESAQGITDGTTVYPFGTTPAAYSSDTDFYPYFSSQPLPDQFDIEFYANSAEPTRVNKTPYLEPLYKMRGTLREECDLMNPSIVIYMAYPPPANYCYIHAFKRFYFITDMVSVRTGLWRLSMHEDVLMSHRVGILGINAIIARQENNYNKMLYDDMITVLPTSDVQVIEPTETEEVFDSTNTGVNHSGYNIVITFVGG